VMTTDYSKLKVTELKELLAARSLPVSGKKEELVVRLMESDAAKPASSTNDLLGDLAPPEEEYDWDTPATRKANESEPEAKSKTSVLPPAKPALSKPTTTTTQTGSSQPDSKPKPSATATTTTTDADTEAALALELEKRKKRAERFGIPLADSAKALERAKKFGVAAPQIDETKKDTRAKRFGNQVWKTDGNQKAIPVKKITDDPTEAEKAKKRMERFGGGNEAKKAKV